MQLKGSRVVHTFKSRITTQFQAQTRTTIIKGNGLTPPRTAFAVSPAVFAFSPATFDMASLLLPALAISLDRDD